MLNASTKSFTADEVLSLSTVVAILTVPIPFNLKLTPGIKSEIVLEFLSILSARPAILSFEFLA